MCFSKTEYTAFKSGVKIKKKLYEVVIHGETGNVIAFIKLLINPKSLTVTKKEIFLS